MKTVELWNSLNRVFPKWSRTFSEFSKSRESNKSLKHELSSISRCWVSNVSYWCWRMDLLFKAMYHPANLLKYQSYCRKMEDWMAQIGTIQAVRYIGVRIPTDVTDKHPISSQNWQLMILVTGIYLRPCTVHKTLTVITGSLYVLCIFGLHSSRTMQFQQCRIQLSTKLPFF